MKRKPTVQWNDQRQEFCARFVVAGRRKYFNLGRELKVAQARLPELLAQYKGAVKRS
jgi:hypothetical protein